MKTNTRTQYCGVPQCKTYRKSGISMHKIPRNVMNNRKELLKWKIVLKMGKPFPKNFVICSLHFEKEQIIVPILKTKRTKATLLRSVIPSKNLPKSSCVSKICIQKIEAKYNRLERRNNSKLRSQQVLEEESEIRGNSEFVDSNYSTLVLPHSSAQKSVGVQVHQNILKFDKGTQATEDIQFNNLPFKIYTDKQLNTVTGIPTRKLLDAIVDSCLIIHPSERTNIKTSLKNRIILTMYRIKSNSSNAQTAILFNLNQKTTKRYFNDCVQLLSKTLECCVYFQTKEENLKSVPTCFAKFKNTMTVLDCTEIKTVQFRCLTCRTCTYSQYKGTHTVKLLIGVSPSGLVNFISTAVGGRTSDKAVFNLTNLLDKLKPGDGVMVDKGFMIGNELSEAGIEMIRPSSMNYDRMKADVENDRLIAAARVHVERRISRIKLFKTLSEKVSLSILPYLDDILTVACAISNLSTPILSDDKFMYK